MHKIKIILFYRLKIIHQKNLLLSSSFIHPFLYKNKIKYLLTNLKEHVNLLLQQILPKHQLLFLELDMLLIVDNRSTDILIKYGNGKKVGEVELWLNKELVEQEELHMDIVIDFILQLYMQI